MIHEVRVTAASRLHFGLFALAAASEASDERSYGGVGVMVAEPLISLLIRDEKTHAEKPFSAAGPLAERTQTFARRWAEFYSQSLDGIWIQVERAPPDHVGLGTGTQLGLAVSAGLSSFRGLPVPAVDELARSVGRGLRSAIGAYGFTRGGMIVDRGKLPGEFLSPLDCRLEVPEDWRFVLVRPQQGAGLSGEPEQVVMEQADPNRAAVTQRLIAEARESLVPAVATGNFPAFAASLGRYCELAGQFYVDVQGGLYNGPRLTALARHIRDLGHLGLGQSSWGPTLFVACPNQTAADELTAALSANHPADELQIFSTPACNQPARISITPPF